MDLECGISKAPSRTSLQSYDLLRQRRKGTLFRPFGDSLKIGNNKSAYFCALYTWLLFAGLALYFCIMYRKCFESHDELVKAYGLLKSRIGEKRVVLVGSAAEH